jgi:hypothetical protein
MMVHCSMARRQPSFRRAAAPAGATFEVEPPSSMPERGRKSGHGTARALRPWLSDRKLSLD